MDLLRIIIRFSTVQDMSRKILKIKQSFPEKGKNKPLTLLTATIINIYMYISSSREKKNC